jgi:hypothetical protein
LPDLHRVFAHACTYAHGYVHAKLYANKHTYAHTYTDSNTNSYAGRVFSQFHDSERMRRA